MLDRDSSFHRKGRLGVGTLSQNVLCKLRSNSIGSRALPLNANHYITLQTVISVSSVGSLPKNMHKHFKLPIKTVKTVYSFVRKAKMARNCHGQQMIKRNHGNNGADRTNNLEQSRIVNTYER